MSRNTSCLRADRRLILLDLAATYGFWIIEDDYDHDFHFETKPVLPLASVNDSSKVIYVSSLSKLLTPGMRIGYLSAPQKLLEELTRVRSFMDRMGDPILEESIAELLDEGEIQRHANKMRAAYRERRDQFVTNLLGKTNGKLEFTIPSGGTAVWLKLPQTVSYGEFADRMIGNGVTPIARSLFAARTLRNPRGTRIGYASLNHREIDLATSAIARSLHLNETGRRPGP